MRRDSIFYQLFAQSPQLLFDLLNPPPANARDYRFDSVAVKEPTFEVVRDRIAQLNLAQLESLAIALLNFESTSDLAPWFQENQ